MKFNVQFPMGAVKHYERWVGDGHLVDVARAAEDAGFDAISMTDHPFPSDAWLAVGGHHSFDPFVALAYIAASTSRLRLLTNLVVAGYRNPYVTAKALASVDVLSGGRTIVGTGVGYLEAEFGVLGGDFARRGAWLDESITAMRAAWSGESVEHESALFPAHGHTMLPRPTQRPGPPIWIGGNGTRAMRRAATLGDGWMPFFQPEAMSRITGTPVLDSVETLAERVTTLHAIRDEVGAAGTFDVCCAPALTGDGPEDRAAELARILPALADAGVTWVNLTLSARSLPDCIAEIGTFAEHVVVRY